MKKREPIRTNFLAALQGLISYTIMWVSDVLTVNPGRRYILIGTPKMGSKYLYFFDHAEAKPKNFYKNLLGSLLTFCPVNLSYKSLLYLENSGRKYI
jgi:hypothetical protein